MNVQLDTNILARLVLDTHPQHLVAQQSVDALKRRGETLCILPQNLYELWTISTRPVAAEGGLGLTIEATKRELARIQKLFVFLPDTATIYDEWEQLVIRHDVKGKPAH